MSPEVIKFLMTCVGYFLIYRACDIGRKPDSELPIFSAQGILQMILVIAGVLTVHHNM
jgi:hypothetical protein